LSVTQVSPHGIAVVEEKHYKDLWSEMGDWVEDDGIDDAPEEPDAAGTVCIYILANSSTVHFSKQLVKLFVLKRNNPTSDLG
jgi:hypothetical protein